MARFKMKKNLSKEHQQYLKKLKKEKALVLFFQIFILIIFLVTWEILATKNILNPFIFSSPLRVLKTIKNMLLNYNLIYHIWITLYETLIAFFLGIILSLGIAIILYQYKILSKIFEPYLTMLNSLPKVALGPLIIIVMGASTKAIITMALLINLIVGIMTIYNGFNNVDTNLIKLFKSLKARKLDILIKLIIPASAKTIISSLKLNISLTLIGVLMGEFLVSKAGIGYLIIYGTQVFNLTMVISGIILLSIISFILYQFIIIFEKKLLN